MIEKGRPKKKVWINHFDYALYLAWNLFLYHINLIYIIKQSLPQ